MEKKKFSHKLSNLYYLALLFIFIFPFSKVYILKTEEVEGIWENVYVLQELDLFLLFLPIVLLSLSFIMVKEKFRRVIFWIIIFFSLLNSFIGIIGFTIPSLDSVPYIGNYIMVLLFPLSLTSFIKNIFVFKKK